MGAGKRRKKELSWGGGRGGGSWEERRFEREQGAEDDLRVHL